MNCKLCHCPTRFVFTTNGYPVFECPACRHRMTEPADAQTHVSEIYSDKYFKGGGAGYPDYLLEGRLLTRMGGYYARVAEKALGKKGSVLDVGAAAGFILKGFADDGWECLGVEPNEKMARHAREHLGLDVRTGTIEAFSAEEKCDCVNLIQVIAHLIDLGHVVERIKECLEIRGVVLVETWDHRSITARLLGKRWHEYSPPSVLHWFSRESCDLLFFRNGFKKIASGRPPKKIACAHALSLAEFKITNSCFSLTKNLISRLVPREITIPYPFDDVFWVLYRLKG